MQLVLSKEATESDVNALIERLHWMGFIARATQYEGKLSVIILKGVDGCTNKEAFMALPLVEEVFEIKQAYKLASKLSPAEKTVFKVKDVTIGGDELFVMAGPCSIESKHQIYDIAKELSEMGIKILRGGAFKPRTSPYSFQGMGEEGLKCMKAAADAFNMVSVTEVMSSEQIDLICEYVDILQVGARNMQNFSLLKELGRAKKPIFLKRGMSATYQDLLMSAEYLLNHGNEQVILCERGIRTYETMTRNTLDLAAVPILKELTHLPVVVDPSHGTGIRECVRPMAKAAIAAGADGLMIEAHTQPEKAFSDKDQTINMEELREIMADCKKVAGVVGRTL